MMFQLLFGLFLSSVALADAFLWFEAETSGGERHSRLSGGAMVWQPPGSSIRRELDIPAAGTYALWVRKFWNPQAIRWKIGTGDWTRVPTDPPLKDLVDLSPSRRVGWFNAGTVYLPAGRASFELEVADPTNTTAYDCFILSRETFHPRGSLKPNEPFALAEAGWFAFETPADPFAESPIDLRELNEKEAGDGGFIAVQDGAFIHARTGRPIRFWGVNTGNEMARRSKAEIDYFARSLAKRGVNLVRLHGPIYKGSGANFGQIDTEQVTYLHYLIAALKREGIYSCLSIYFPLWVRLGPENSDFPGYTGQHPFGLLYFHEKFQALYRSWWNYLLTTPNPHTGLALREDPSVAMIELINEDSLLFWTFNPGHPNSNIPEPQRALVEKQFGDWLLAQYPEKSLDTIRADFWNGLRTPHDAFAFGRVGLRSLWNVVNDRTPRDQDTVRFLIDLQVRFYRDTYSYVKDTLGFQGLVSSSNWQTASAQYLGPLDKWSNTFTDFMDRHGYFGGKHTGNAASYSVRSGQRYRDRSALFLRSADNTGHDFNNPLFDITYAGQPGIVSEIGWPLPNRFRGEFPVLAAAYGSLQGSDGVFHFAAGAPSWGGLPGKFEIQTPSQIGQYPATARIFRQGLVKTAPPVATLQLPVEDLLRLKGTSLPTPQNFDQLRSNDIPPDSSPSGIPAIDPLAFLVGRVEANFIKDTGPRSQVSDLAPFIDHSTKIAKSHTGELTWNWALGLATINAPTAQGITGFLVAAGKLDLADSTMESPLEYGSLLLVALDGSPLATSRKILLQVMSEERPHQWETQTTPDELEKIINTGQPPLLIRNLEGTVSLKRPDAVNLRVTALDANGYPTGETFKHGNAISLRPERFYYLIESP